MKRLFLMLMVVGMLSIGQAAVIGDFENSSLDGWTTGWDSSLVSMATSQTAGTVTLNDSSLAVVTDGSGYWPCQMNVAVPSGPLTTFSFDVSVIMSEWSSGGIWLKVADKIAFNSNGASGYKEWTTATAVNRADQSAASLSGGTWESDWAKTITLDVSDYDLTGATWFQYNISIQGGDSQGAFYFDNVQLVPEPATLALLGLGALAVRRRK